MNKTPPPYIAAAQLSTAPPDYTWNDLVESDLQLPQPRIAHRLAEMSHRAVLAFSLGSLEWTLWRLRDQLPDDTAFLMLDACWAGVVNWLYLDSFDNLPDWEEELDRAIAGPLAMSFNCLAQCFYDAEERKPFTDMAVTISEVALKVCGQPDTFKAWRRTTIERLAQAYPKDMRARTGRPVPREALDPAYQPSEQADDACIAAYLRSLDVAQNYCLSEPQGMKDEGFQGTPYEWPPRPQDGAPT